MGRRWSQPSAPIWCLARADVAIMGRLTLNGVMGGAELFRGHQRDF